LVDIADGDTPNIRMPIRVLSVDTSEVTAKTAGRAAAVDTQFAQHMTTGIILSRRPPQSRPRPPPKQTHRAVRCIVVEATDRPLRAHELLVERLATRRLPTAGDAPAEAGVGRRIARIV
jgi:hypothetical protein